MRENLMMARTSFLLLILCREPPFLLILLIIMQGNVRGERIRASLFTFPAVTRTSISSHWDTAIPPSET